MKIINIQRTTTAPASAIWDLWSDITQRKRWDDSLASIEASGDFRVGQLGTVTLKGQLPRRFEVLNVNPETLYVDCFYLPMGGRMIWRHTISDDGPTRTVTFEVSVMGPTAFLLVPIMKAILKKDLPRTVDKLIRCAEEDAKS